MSGPVWFALGHGDGPAAALLGPAIRHGHKQGSVAVVVSVLGLAALVVLIVFLGSLSARRRMRDTPPDPELRPGEPPGRDRRGLFG